ncbi:MAG: hypothetical protein GY719_25415 [bacterium]|nr:hypothetical protein [bacterium]
MLHPKDLTGLLRCLNPKQKRFAKKHWDRLVELHPEFCDPTWQPDLRRWWVNYYHAKESRLDDEPKCREWLWGKEQEARSETPSTDRELHSRSAGEAPTEATSPDNLTDAFFEKAVDLLPELVKQERERGRLSRIQENALRIMILIIRKPLATQRLDSMIISGRINTNALTSAINKRARRQVITNYTLAQALDVIFKRIRRDTGKSGHMGLYKKNTKTAGRQRKRKQPLRPRPKEVRNA